MPPPPPQFNIWAIQPKQRAPRRRVSPPPPPPIPSSAPPPSPPPAPSDAPATASVSNSLALHKASKQWLDTCVNTSTIESALPSSEYWRQRRHYDFYKHLECVVKRYAASAKTALDVGSSLPPYLNALPWLEERTILGPRFAGNVKKGGTEMLSTARIAQKFGVVAIQADFLDWTPAAGGRPYDLVLCSEVVEHVPKPKEFVRKLLTVGRVVVLSVPYRWAPSHDDAHHLNNKITRDRIASWAGRQPNAYDIVEEEGGEQRIICVYKC